MTPQPSRRGSQRRADSIQRTWDAKYAAADTIEKQATVAFDHVRATIPRLPVAKQEAAWEHLKFLLVQFQGALNREEV